MGVVGALFQFDLTRYHDVVVAAFRVGEDHPVLAATLRRLAAAGWPDEVTGTGLTDALDYVGEVRRIWPCFIDELKSQGWNFEMISLLYLWTVLRETVDAYADVSRLHLGKVFDTPSPRAGELLDLLSTPPDDELWLPGIDNIQITGWLDPTHTAELLRLLPPPDTQPAPEPDPVRRLCQQQALALLERAVQHKHGVLWATEITISSKTHQQHMFTDRTPPTALGPFPTPHFPQFFDPIDQQPYSQT